MKRTFISIVVITMLLAWGPALAGQQPLHVVATVQPYYLLVRALAGSHVTLDIVYPANQSPHLYEPAPSDIKKMADADLVIANGLDLEARIATTLKTTYAAKTTFASSFISAGSLLPAVRDDDDPASAKPGSRDPHIWLEADFLCRIAQGVADKLIALDPRNQASYRMALTQMLDSIQKIDRVIKSERAYFREANVVTMHNAFQYFFKRYSIVLAGVIEPFPGKKPAPRDMIALAEMIKKYHIRTLFREPQLDAKVIEAMAGEFHLSVYTLDPEGAFLRAQSPQEILLLNWNVLKVGFAR